ncbi:hypothetical protein LJY25_13230 [Hymenobacter sp. BT175]|uniref:hypothetical protein n=1 Tax=Hymenobacter translucens TaxID=2886507 RepID=UPI001D0F0262|nr:hypothetical protein [Hymenobacter translucens]MCC2547412.1 hypothetical protein [Hymenobacter translucens]
MVSGLAAAPSAQAQSASGSDSPTFGKEFTYGVNFNTQGGLIGGVSVRSTRVLNEQWSRFWGVEGVEVKHPKEQHFVTNSGGSVVMGKTNYLFVLRPSVGLQRVIFRKAPDSGVQVNGLVGAGPSIGLLMPYYITYDYTLRDSGGHALSPEDIRSEQYNPDTHTKLEKVLDRSPVFSGISETKPNIGAHLRGALSFEYGRYREAVAGVETGFLFEAYTKRLTILRDRLEPDSRLSTNFFPSVYLTIYLGHRN